MNQKGIPKKRRLRLIRFQAQIGDCLIRAGKIVERNGKRERPSAERNETAAKSRKTCSSAFSNKRSSTGQSLPLPRVSRKAQRCRHCKDGFSTAKCSKCNIYLCLVKKRNCFADFHN